MEFLGVGPLELLLIFLIALLVIPPQELGKVGRSLGRFLNRMYRSETWRMFRQASSELQNLPNRLAREAQLEELHQIEKEMALPDLKNATSAAWPPEPVTRSEEPAPLKQEAPQTGASESNKPDASPAEDSHPA